MRRQGGVGLVWAMPKPPGDVIQPAAGRPTRGRAVKMSRNDQTAGGGSPRRSTVPSEGAQAPRRAGNQLLVDRGVMWQASCTCGWAHPGSFRKKRNALRLAEQHLWQVDGQ